MMASVASRSVLGVRHAVSAGSRHMSLAAPPSRVAAGAGPAELLADLKRRSKIRINYGRVSPKYVNRVLLSSAAAGSEPPSAAVALSAPQAVAVAAVTAARGHANMTRLTGDLLVKSLLSSGDAHKGAGAAVDAVRHPHSGLTLSSRSAGSLFRAAGIAGDPDLVKRTLSMAKERGLAPTEPFTSAGIRAAFATSSPRQAAKLYVARLSYAHAAYEPRCLFRLAVGLKALPSPGAPLTVRGEKGAPGSTFSPTGEAVLSSVQAAIAAGEAETAPSPGKGLRVSPGLLSLLRELQPRLTVPKVELAPAGPPAEGAPSKA
jgi:hypothetical protein